MWEAALSSVILKTTQVFIVLQLNLSVERFRVALTGVLNLGISEGGDVFRLVPCSCSNFSLVLAISLGRITKKQTETVRVSDSN